MDFFRRATIALANSPADAELLAYAANIAATAGGAIHFACVHVLPAGGTVRPAAGPVPTHRDAMQSLRSMVANHIGRAAATECHVVSGHRVDKLLEFAAESQSDCILAGHRSGGTGRRSLCRRLAMKAPCSLWMVPQGSPPGFTKILAAVDFSVRSAHALSLAARLAARARAERCVVVHVRAPGAHSPDAATDELGRREAQQALEHFLAPLDLSDVDVQMRIETSGSVVSAISRVADEVQADLVVMGTRGLSASAAVLLGSESEQMLAESKRPLLVTKHRGERLGVLEVLLDKDLQPRGEPEFS